MRNIVLAVLLSVAFLPLSAQNVGIGVTSPTERLQVDSNVRIGGPVYTGPANRRVLKFGDLDYVTIGEDSADDRMQMKAKNFIFSPSLGNYNGNVGIGTTGAPAAKLDVIGSVKITDGTQSAGRVFTSNALGVGSWQEPASCMTGRFVVTTPGTGTFTVPAGVTRIFVELWSAGGSGSQYSSTPSLQVTGGGGGSGAYGNVYIDVAPGNVWNYLITAGSSGTVCRFYNATNTLTLYNGGNADNITGPGDGSSGSFSDLANAFIMNGNEGKANENTVYTISGTTYVEYRGGDGGAAPFGGAGGLGGISRAGYTGNYSNGKMPGGGGGAGTTNGAGVNIGGGGALIVHY